MLKAQIRKLHVALFLGPLSVTPLCIPSLTQVTLHHLLSFLYALSVPVPQPGRPSSSNLQAELTNQSQTAEKLST